MTKNTGKAEEENDVKEWIVAILITVFVIIGLIQTISWGAPIISNHFTENHHRHYIEEFYDDQCELETGTYIPCSTGWMTITVD